MNRRGKYYIHPSSICYFDRENILTSCLVSLFKYLVQLCSQWTIYSATTFLENCRKVVREKWFEKSGLRNLVREKWLTEKMVVLYYKSTFFQVGEKWLTKKKSEFEELLF